MLSGSAKAGTKRSASSKNSTEGVYSMISEKSRNNINFVRIVIVLKNLLSSGMISTVEYKRAKEYYKKITGADIAVID